jgi:putative DNA primase/helicase
MKENDSDPFQPIAGTGAKEPTPRRQAATWAPMVAIPDDAKAPPASHYQHGRPSLVHEYRDADNRLLGFVCRFENANGGKLFCPLTWCRNVETGQSDWRWKAWEAPRPLYGLDRLADRPEAPVVVCEGEKAADAARELLHDYVAVTSPNGSRSAGKADWRALLGRRVVIWPDADEAGERYAQDVVAALLKFSGRGAEPSIVKPPTGRPSGWDAADALLEGWTSAQAHELIDAARPVRGIQSLPSGSGGQDDEAKSDASGRRGQGLRSSLLELVEDCEFWHDQERRAFASVLVGDHAENMRLSSHDFSVWLSGRCYKQLGEPVGEQVLRDTVRALEARAIHDGPSYQTFRRVGGKGDKIYLDLGGPDWRVVAIGPHGWKITSDCPLKPVRTPHMLALPVPEAGELLESHLRPFINVASDRDFRLIVSWLVTALRNVGEYPILSISGEQGSAKSTVARMLRMLVDPNKAANRAAPKDERDLATSAYNAHVLSLDNLSGVPAWLSDALCRIATGGGFSARANYTDLDEVVAHLENPIILNGIPESAGRPDLVDRAILINLPAIPSDKRRSSADVWADFEVKRPVILGSLLDAVSAALRNLPETKLHKLPRMANAAKFVTAAESGLGWEPGTHLADLEANRQQAVETSLENEPVAVGIMEMGEAGLPWSGTATQLHEKLSARMTGIPKTAIGLGTTLRRIGPSLAEMGIAIQYHRARVRHITIRRVAD